MAFTLDRIVPWGRSYDEYVRMFGLSPTDLELPLLGCGDGPAGFNSAMARRGRRVISVDPLYQVSGARIKRRIDATYAEIMQQLTANRDDYVWRSVESPEELGRVRMTAMTEFLADFENGAQEGRYLAAGLPALPFRDREFAIALCSHLLFVYSDHLSMDFHRQALFEMCRVAGEARIFPLLTLKGKRSPWLDPLIADLQRSGYAVAIEKVPYEFQRGGNRMLRIRMP